MVNFLLVMALNVLKPDIIPKALLLREDLALAFCTRKKIIFLVNDKIAASDKQMCLPSVTNKRRETLKNC